ncbi:hypothetical protein QYM36_019052 [Artemia franciscana]|uniref:ATP-dependent DNA helicase n=1 Tax=Artemia franciscana TaxID=6661 RepID=A0AA88HBI2_ARTSF|nr:hypothetical protein QYM36_019052 [Artemia franciscana]
MKSKYDEEKQEISEIRRTYYQENKDRIKEDVKSRFQTNEMAKERNQTKALKRNFKLYAASQDYRSRKKQAMLTQYNNHKDKFSQLFGDYYKRNRDILTAKLWVRKEMKNGTPTPLSRTKHGKKGDATSSEMHYCNTEDSKEAIKLEFARANNVIEMATNSLAKRHALNAAKCEKFLDNLPEDEPPTLEDFTTAMDNVYTVIPIDEEGSARFFQQSETETPVRPKQKCSCLPPSYAQVVPLRNKPSPAEFTTHGKNFPLPESQCSQTQDDDLSSEDENEKYIPPRKEKKNTKKDDNDDDEDVIPVTKRFVDKVTNAVKSPNKTAPLRMIVSGFGGAGKSVVIKVIRNILCHHFSKDKCPVIVMAPTGLAAYSIKGETIHRGFSLPVDQAGTSKYSELYTEQLLTLRAILQKTYLFIIDEISMVSALAFMYIHLRLTEVMSINAVMGNANMLVFGDFLQLRPVSANPPFKQITRLEIKNRIGSMGTFDLWSHFEYDELAINMRQKTDTDYADLLANIRVGICTDNNHEQLQRRKIESNRRATNEEIADKYIELVALGKTPVILMPRNVDCRSVNETLLAKTSDNISTFTAIDRLSTVLRDKRIEAEAAENVKSFENDSKRTAGSISHLKLALGARVMLQRNVNVEEGLVNGSMGYVKVIKMTAANIAVGIEVQFDGQDKIMEIERETVKFEALKEVYYTRRQFPLTLAYAINIHKSQGLSLQTALVDAGDRCFGPDTEALVEYNRLRQKYRPDLPQFAIPEPFKVPTVPVAKQQPVKRKPSSSTSIDVPSKKSKPDAAKDKPKTNPTPARKVKPTTSEAKKKAPTKRLNAEAVETSFPTKKTQHDTTVKQNYRSGIGPGRKGLKNTDGSVCYANATMQSLFAMHYKLFEVLSVMHGPLAEELKRLALSSLGKNETMDTVRSLLPPQHNYTGRDQQSLCEFWLHLFEQLDAEHQANDMSPLRSLYQFKIHRFSVCSTCHWSKTALHPEGTPDCPFPITCVLNPNDPAIKEIIDNNDISFSSVLIPEQPGETCPNGHVTKLKTVFTQAPEDLALNLDRRTLCHKIT